jgi:outer membrane protein OmpA-like peptidoglycan-associated protein
VDKKYSTPSMENSMNWKIVIILLSLALILGCGSKDNFIVLDPSEDGSRGALEIKTNKGSTVLEEEGMAVYVSDINSKPSAPTPISETEKREFFQDALRAQPLVPESFLLYFQFNSNKLTKESRLLIPAILESVGKRDSKDISVIGHTDRTGNDAYNQKLSLKRARAVYDILAAENVDSEDISINYHGEGNPLVPTADNVAEPRNRRVEVLVR